jgi:hypothetical protein
LHLQTNTGHSGISVSPEAFKANLLYLKSSVLPVGWQLNAVQKWNAYGHNITELAGVGTNLSVPISVLTNQEARDVIMSAQKAGVKKPTIWRIMPASGPAKYAEILEAAKSGVGIQVRQKQSMLVAQWSSQFVRNLGFLSAMKQLQCRPTTQAAMFNMLWRHRQICNPPDLPPDLRSSGSFTTDALDCAGTSAACFQSGGVESCMCAMSAKHQASSAVTQLLPRQHESPKATDSAICCGLAVAPWFEGEAAACICHACMRTSVPRRNNRWQYVLTWTVFRGVLSDYAKPIRCLNM